MKEHLESSIFGDRDEPFAHDETAPGPHDDPYAAAPADRPAPAGPPDDPPAAARGRGGRPQARASPRP